MHSKNSDHHCNLRFTDYSKQPAQSWEDLLDLAMFWSDLRMTLGERTTTDKYLHDINDMIWVCQWYVNLPKGLKYPVEYAILWHFRKKHGISYRMLGLLYDSLISLKHHKNIIFLLKVMDLKHSQRRDLWQTLFQSFKPWPFYPHDPWRSPTSSERITDHPSKIMSPAELPGTFIFSSILLSDLLSFFNPKKPETSSFGGIFLITPWNPHPIAILSYPTFLSFRLLLGFSRAPGRSRGWC